MPTPWLRGPEGQRVGTRRVARCDRRPPVPDASERGVAVRERRADKAPACRGVAPGRRSVR